MQMFLSKKLKIITIQHLRVKYCEQFINKVKDSRAVSLNNVYDSSHRTQKGLKLPSNVPKHVKTER